MRNTPVMLASEMHRKFVYIHPFPDGNGRIARLIMNTILLQEHYLPIHIKAALRGEYINALENGRIFPTEFDTLMAEQELSEQHRFARLLNISTFPLLSSPPPASTPPYTP